MDFFSDYKFQLEKSLTKSQSLTLQLLVWLLQVQKDVKIERLAGCLPIPILYESRRQKIQRLLASSTLSLSLFWFPIIKSIVEKEFPLNKRLILVLDRTQWSDKNVFMISVIWRNRALPIYWLILEKKGSIAFRSWMRCNNSNVQTNYECCLEKFEHMQERSRSASFGAVRSQ